MSIAFQSLFTIQVLHDYYNNHNLRCADFDIVPTEDCSMLMKNMRILHKNYNNKLLTLISSIKQPSGLPLPAPPFTYTPFINFNNDIVFRYYLLSNNFYFSNFTATALKFSEKKRYYLSNLSKNKVADTLSLSNAIAPFTVSKKYEPGNLVKAPDNTFYENTSKSDDTPESTDISNTNYWQQAPETNPYVNSADELTLVGEIYIYKLQTPAANIVIKIFSLDKTNDNLPFDKLIETVEKSFTQTQADVTIDLSKKLPAKYKIVVNNEDPVFIYVDPVAVKRDVFGIIEIFHFEKVPIDFQLLAATGNLKVPEVVFTLWFKNRSVTWKYISQNGDIGVTDSATPALSFIPASAALVQSEKAIALAEKPVKTLTATRTGPGASLKNLTNPQIEKIVFEQNGNTGFFAGNMFVKIDT